MGQKGLGMVPRGSMVDSFLIKMKLNVFSLKIVLTAWAGLV